MSSIKVLVVYHYIAKYRVPVFKELLSSDRIDVYVASDTLANNDIELANEEFYNSSKFIKLDNHWLSKKTLWQKGLIATVFSGRYDAVVFLGDPFFFSTWLSLLLLKLCETKTILWTHGFVRGDSIKDKLKLVMYSLADGLFLYGNKARSNLINKNVSPSKIHTIYNSLDYKTQKYHRVNFEKSMTRHIKIFSENAFQLVFVGRLTFHKELNILIDLVNEVSLRGAKVNLLFIGDGEARSSLESYTDSFELIRDNVCFYGKTYNEAELCSLIMTSDLCVSPGEIGLTAMHVLSYGVPIITHNNEMEQMPEFEAVIDGVTGSLFKKGDFNGLVELVLNYINGEINVNAADCIEIIEGRYTPEVQKKLITKALRDVIGKN